LPFTSNGDGFGVVEGKRLRELYCHIVGILFPKRRKHGTTFSSAVVEDVAQPYLEIARIPDPSGK
jgi:hypothetical protein